MLKAPHLKRQEHFVEQPVPLQSFTDTNFDAYELTDNDLTKVVGGTNPHGDYHHDGTYHHGGGYHDGEYHHHGYHHHGYYHHGEYHH